MSKRFRQSRLFSGQPDLLLVEEYPSIVLPDATDLPRRPASTAQSSTAQSSTAQDGGFIEVLEEDDDTDEDDGAVTARIFISSPRSPALPASGHDLPAVPAAGLRLGRPRQLGTPRVVAGFAHASDLPSPAHVAPRPAAAGYSEPDSEWQDSGWDDEEESGNWNARLDVGRNPIDVSDEDSDEDFDHRPEPLRLALPQAAGDEASLILAAGAVEDFDDDWDEEDDWSEEFSDDDSEDDDNESIRLSLGSNSSLDFLRDLEERRSFKAPIWGPRPNSTGFDADISFYDEAEEEVDEYEDAAAKTVDLVGFEEAPEPPGMASVRVGAPIGSGRPRPLSTNDDDDDADVLSDEEETLVEIGFQMPQFSASDPLRAPNTRMRWSEDPTTDEVEEPLEGWSDFSGMAEDPVHAFLPGRSDEPVIASTPLPAVREPAPRRRAAPPAKPVPPARGISPTVSAAAVFLLAMSATGLIWVQFHEELGLPFPDATLEAAPEAPLLPEAPAELSVTAELPAVEEAPQVPQVEAPEAPSLDGSEGIIGKLMVTCDRPAAVFINNEKIGITPLDGPLDLDAGTYEVRATELRTGKKQSLQARVDAGKVLQVSFEFR